MCSSRKESVYCHLTCAHNAERRLAQDSCFVISCHTLSYFVNSQLSNALCMVTIAVVGTLSKRNPGQFLKFARQLDEQPTDSHTESIALISDSAMPLCTHNHSYGKPLQTIANPATRFPPCHEGQKGNSLSDAHQSSLHRGLILRTMPPKYVDIHKILSASSSSSFLRTKQKQPVREAVKTKGEDWGVASPKCRRGGRRNIS